MKVGLPYYYFVWRLSMNLIGDFFALGLVAILSLFFFQNGYFPTKASRFFAFSLILTALTGVLDIIAVYMFGNPVIPMWLNMAINSMFFAANVLTTTMIAMVLFYKILEHVHDDHCIKQARLAMIAVFTIYLIFVAVNIGTGILFYFDDDGIYHRGPLNSIGYAFTVAQMVLVIICYIRNRKYAASNMKKAIIQVFPPAVLCILLQLLFPDILLNCLIMSFAELVIFLNFHSNVPGHHVLTNLNDRHKFFAYIEDSISSNTPFKAYVVRIKNFDTVNQKYGHKTGDEILYLFAFSLEKAIKRATAFHMNDLRFSLIVRLDDKLDHSGDLDALISFLDGGIKFKDDTIYLDYNIVENEIRTDRRDANLFYEELEFAMDIAREKNLKHFVYSQRHTAMMLHRRYLIDRLKNVDCEHGFEVWFQPIYCLTNEKFCSMESLLRMTEPDGSFVSPAEFIPIAESAGMINQITWFVLDQSCRAIASNPALNKANVSINLPMEQLFEENFVQELNRIVDGYGIDHSQICLELTERAMTDDFAKAKAYMERVTALGYRFFLDDFGTGMSNFNCLLDLPFKNVKLDMCLTATIVTDTTQQTLVSTLTELFHRMDAFVIAEGAETEQQVELLKKYGIDRIQGYYFARPMRLDSLLDFYKKNPLEAEQI